MPLSSNSIKRGRQMAHITGMKWRNMNSMDRQLALSKAGFGMSEIMKNKEFSNLPIEIQQNLSYIGRSDQIEKELSSKPTIHELYWKNKKYRLSTHSGV